MHIINDIFKDRAFMRRVLTLLVPMIIQMAITNVVSLLDNLMVGRVGTLEMAAVSIANYLLFVFYLCIFGGLSGIGIFSTQYAGAKDNNGIRHCFRAKWLVGTIMVTVCTFILAFHSNWLIGKFVEAGATPEDTVTTIGHAATYIKIMLTGLFPFCIGQIYASTLKELGETKLPMIASVFAILINLIFNWLLIFGACGFPKLGVSGAAIATVLSRFVEMLIICIYTHRRKHIYQFIIGAYNSFHIPLLLIVNIIKRGFPLLINEFLWAAGVTATLQCYSLRGLDVIAANAIVSTAWNIFNILFISIGIAAGIIIGQLLGAGEIEKAKFDTNRILWFSLIVTAVTGVLMFIAAKWIPEMYNTTQNVKLIANGLLKILAILMPLYGFTHACYFILRSGGRTLITFAFDSLFTWGITLPLAWLLVHKTALTIFPLYFIVQSTEIGKATLGFIFIKKGLWIRNIIGSDKKTSADNPNF